jgi:hypothetical protein
MGGEGDRVPRYLVSWNNRVENNKRLFLQYAYIESCRVVYYLRLVKVALWFGITFNGDKSFVNIAVVVQASFSLGQLRRCIVLYQSSTDLDFQ